MSEYREALARMTLAIQTNPMVLSDAVIATEYHAAKALLARGEPQKSNLRHAAEFADWGQVAMNGGPPCFHLDSARFCLRAERWAGHDAHGQMHRFISLAELVGESVEPAAAEKAREPMHEGFPVDTIVRDIFTDKVGTIVSYHCRFEVEWADGSKSMDVHSRQLDHCGPMPSPPAATGEK